MLTAIYTALAAFFVALWSKDKAEASQAGMPALRLTPLPPNLPPLPRARDVLEIPPTDITPKVAEGRSAALAVPYWALFVKWAERYKIDPFTLAAIGWQESGGTFDPSLIGDGGRSLGFMQVLCDPDKNGHLRRWISGRPEFNSLTKKQFLASPDVQIDYAAYIHASNSSRARSDAQHVSLYNSWSTRLSGPSGPFPTIPNDYAERVLAQAERYRRAA